MGGGASGPEIKSYKFVGVVFQMAQHEKKTKSVGEPHTEFRVAVDKIEQNIFESIMEDLALGGQRAEIIIKTYRGKKK